MKITVIGAGYVGLVTAACFSELGNDVCCLDVNPTRIANLQNGVIPIHEPGLTEIIMRNQAAGRLKFTLDVKESVDHGVIQFIAVGTPSDEDGSADLQYVVSAAQNIGKYMTEYKVIVDKSTVPVGTAEKVKNAIDSLVEFDVVSNPEFLKEGAAIDDFMRPDRIVIGCESEKARLLLKELYKPFNRNHERTLWMKIRDAEFTKYAANAMLATRISFMNELSNLADRVGVDIESVRLGIGADPRIGHHFLYSGAGYGGSCFPKDVQALGRTASEYGQSMHILNAVELVNDKQKYVLGAKVLARFGDHVTELEGRHFAIWGLAFKPNTDDMREAPSTVLIKQLLNDGATVAVYDPVAMNEARRVFEVEFTEEERSRIRFADSEIDALEGADALCIITEWKTFRSPDFQLVREKMINLVIFDGRNLYDPEMMEELHFEYYGIGRGKNLGSW